MQKMENGAVIDFFTWFKKTKNEKLSIFSFFSSNEKKLQFVNGAFLDLNSLKIKNETRPFLNGTNYTKISKNGLNLVWYVSCF